MDNKKILNLLEFHKIYSLLCEITNVPGYNPVGIAEFFKFMSSKTIPQEDKDLVKQYSAAHLREPEAGHDLKLRELFKKHGIDLTGVVRQKKTEPESEEPIPQSEEVKKDILPKSGGGAWGTENLLKSYTRDTPGSSYKKIKKMIGR